MKPYFLALLSLLVAASLHAQLPLTEEQVIEYSKSIDVKMIDPSLPSGRLEDWLRSGPPHAKRVSWQSDATCDTQPDPSTRDAVFTSQNAYTDPVSGERCCTFSISPHSNLDYLISSGSELLWGGEMTSRIGTVALLALVGTLFVLLCPAASGPFTATNGPATAFRAAAAFHALLTLVCGLLIIAVVQLSAVSVTLDLASASRARRDFAPFSLRC